MCFESWIDEENDLKSRPSEDKSVSELQTKPISNEIQKLLSRKEELEQKQRNEELRQKRVQVWKLLKFKKKKKNLVVVNWWYFFLSGNIETSIVLYWNWNQAALCCSRHQLFYWLFATTREINIFFIACTRTHVYSNDSHSW